MLLKKTRLALIYIVLVSLYIAEHVNGEDEISISSAAVLLPADSSVKYRIEAFGGCFKWSVQKSNLIHLTTEDECGTRAVLQVTSLGAKISERESTWIWIEETTSQKSLRCEVFIDFISRIEILTTTRTLNRYEEQLLRVQAFDAEGNLFSSVDGLEFQWSLQPENLAGEASSVVKLLTFKDSGIECSDTLLHLEAMGKQGDAILIQAIDTGRVRVSTQIAGSRYSDVETASVTLSVLEPFLIQPGEPVYLPPFTSFKLTLELINEEGDFKPLDLPNPQYLWSSSNPDVAIVEQSGVVKTFDKFETTSIQVAYVGIDEGIRKSVVNVVEPAYLSLRITPKFATHTSADKTSWSSASYLIEGQTYVVDVAAFDANNHRLSCIDSLHFTADVSDQYLEVLDRSANGAHFELKPTKLGRTEITIALSAAIGDPKLGIFNLQRPLAYREEVFIVKPITIYPHQAVISLPYVAATKQTYQLQASGGSGFYSWHSTNTSVAVVNKDGLVTAMRPGIATIRCADARDAYNVAQIDVRVSDPSSLVFVPSFREVEVGSNLVIAVALMESVNGGDATSYDNCSAAPISWAITSGSDIISALTPVPCTTFEPAPAANKVFIPCACSKIEAKAEGQARITATFEFANALSSYSEADSQLSASINIAAFRPLLVEPQHILVTLGATYIATITGGPLSSHSISPTVSLSNPSAVSYKLLNIQDASTKGSNIAQNQLLLTCNELGSQTIAIEVSNPPSLNNPYPVTSRREIQFECKHPYRVFAYPSELEAIFRDGETTKLSESAAKCMDLVVKSFSELSAITSPSELFDALPTKFTLRNNHEIPFNLTLYDDLGHVFDNFSTLEIEWTISNETLAAILPKAKDHVILNLSHLEGKTTLQVKVNGYDASILSSRQKVSLTEFQKLSHDFELSLRNNVQLTPTKLSVYLHPLNKNTIQVSGGSGRQHVVIDDPSIADVIFDPTLSRILVTPLKAGVATITAHDSCLSGSVPATSVITVSEIASIQVKAHEMLRLGDHAILNVEVMDSNGGVFDSSQLKFIDFNIYVEGHAVEVSKDTSTDDSSGPRFIAVGKSVGVSTISISAVNTLSGSLVSSLPLQLYVYPGLRVIPSALDLVPGASHQLVVAGGPPFQLEVTYSISNETVAEIDKDGFIHAKHLGECEIRVVAYAVSTSKVLIGESNVKLRVKYLRGIRIHASTTRLIAGEELMMHVEGVDHEPPTVWGGLDVGFRWDVENPVIANFKPVFELANVTLDEERGFIVRVKALSAGTTRISVRAVSGPVSLVSRTTSITLDVIPPLTLRGSSYLTSDSQLRTWAAQRGLLLTPGASYHLVSNIGQTHFELMDNCGSTAAQDELTTAGSAVIQIHQGLIRSLGVAGYANVLVTERRDGQTALIHVVVKPIRHIELRPRSPVYYNLPVGSSMEFDIVLRDDLGREFDAYDGTEFAFELSRQDIFSVEIRRTNESSHRYILRVKGIRPGQAFLRIYIVFADKSSHIVEHYQLLRVSNAISPSMPLLHVGARVNFTTPFAHDESYRSVWSSGNDEILRIDAVNGSAVAIAPGRAAVYHNSSVFTHTHARVARVASIELDSELCVPTIIQQGRIACRIPLKFKDAEGFEFSESPDIHQNILFECSVSRSDVKVEALYTPVDGHRYCVIYTDYVDAKETSARLAVMAYDNSRSYSTTAQQSITFASTFIINGPQEIHLTRSEPSTTIEISSSHPVSAKAQNEDRITVREVRHDVAQKRYYFLVTVHDGPSFSSSPVEFYNELTNQRQTIRISFDSGISTLPTSSHYQSAYIWLLVCILLAGAFCLFWWYNT